MTMPRQLEAALLRRRAVKKSDRRPTVELMPAININELRHAIPRAHGQTNEPDVSLKYPGLAYLRLSASALEIMGRNGHLQRFRIVWVPTYFGKHRAILACSSCGCGTTRLFDRYGNYACRHCHRALYASQQNDQFGRKRLTAAKLRLALGSVPDINEPMPPKPKWTRRRTYQHIRHEIQTLEAKAKPRRFRKPISTQLFAYHVS
jgi:hypothetical protein